MALPLHCFVFASNESSWVGRSLYSVSRSAASIRGERNIQLTALVRGRDVPTIRWFESIDHSGWDVVFLPDGDLTEARRVAASRSGKGLAAFIDASDLIAENWLSRACRVAGQSHSVWRPEAIMEFGDDVFSPAGYQFTLQSDGQSGPTGTNDLTSGFVTTAEVLRAVPWPTPDRSRGWLDVDWWWNCLAAEKGISHRVVPGCVHFRRSSVRPRIELNRFGPT